jgi:hypothetical protein
MPSHALRATTTPSYRLPLSTDAGEHGVKLGVRRSGRLPRRREPIAVIPGHEVNVVVEHVLPRCFTVRLRDIEPGRCQPMLQLVGHRVDGTHHLCGLVGGECPKVGGMPTWNDESVPRGRLPAVEKGDRRLVFVDAPRLLGASDDRAEDAILHRCPACRSHWPWTNKPATRRRWHGWRPQQGQGRGRTADPTISVDPA